MARSRKKPETNRSLPGLFDSLDGFQERVDGDFEIIPPHKIRQLSAELSLKEKDTSAEIDQMKPLERQERLLFMSFGSGSWGNCSYVGTREEGILVDAGVDLELVLRGMRQNGLTMSSVKAVLLTHDHGDHIRCAYQIVRKYNLKLMCTPRVLNGILRRHNVSRRIKDYHNPIYKEFTVKIAGMEVTPFEVKHDGMDNSGFFITFGDKKMTIATDLGCISDRVRHYMTQSNVIVIESNYDLQMLIDGPYAEYLKARIKSDTGHLDNAVTARFIAEIRTEALTHVFLCHLSHENNTPEIAASTMAAELAKVGVTRLGDGLDPLVTPRPQLNLIVLPRQTHTPLYIL